MTNGSSITIVGKVISLESLLATICLRHWRCFHGFRQSICCPTDGVWGADGWHMSSELYNYILPLSWIVLIKEAIIIVLGVRQPTVSTIVYNIIYIWFATSKSCFSVLSQLEISQLLHWRLVQRLPPGKASVPLHGFGLPRESWHLLIYFNQLRHVTQNTIWWT